MKKKEKQVLQGMSDEELTKRITMLEAEILKGNLGRKVRGRRKEIAIAKTMLRERAL